VVQAIQGKLDASGKRFAIVVSRWNELVTKELLAGALSELSRFGAENVEVIHVPGTWEIPPVVQSLVSRDTPPAGVVALGCILQGQTTHAKLLGGDVSSALMDIQVQTRIPVAWGILTPDTLEQALDRSGMKHGNKGREAALAAIEMSSIFDQLD
jgi:6,7-dimethyl-8-ribityllumazine synthase